MELDLLSNIKHVLNHYLDSIEKSTCVFISTMDGHLLIERNRDPGVSIDTISPMAGSLLGISETIAQALNNQQLEDALIMMNDCTLGLLKISGHENSLYLGIISPRHVNLGKLLVNGKIAIRKISELLDELPS